MNSRIAREIAKGRMIESLNRLSTDMKDSVQVVKTQLNEDLEKTMNDLSPAEQIRRHPKSAIAGAFIAGALVGIALPAVGAKAAISSGKFATARKVFGNSVDRMFDLAQRGGIAPSKLEEHKGMILSLAAQIAGGLVTKLLAEHSARRDRNNLRDAKIRSVDEQNAYKYHA